MAVIRTLYDKDFFAWAKQQADALRAAARGAASNQLDWENLAEEIESLGISQRTALRSQIRRILRHLFKLEASAVGEPRRGWKESIRGARAEIEDILKASPSLRRELAELVAEQTPRAAKLSSGDLEDHGEPTDAIQARLDSGGYTVEQVLGDWFPEIG